MKADDFEPGIFVTVTACIAAPEDRSYRGDVLKVLHVELPFIVLETPCPYVRRFLPTLTLDTRDWRFMRLSDDFVRLTYRPDLDGPLSGQGKVKVR